MNADLLRIGMAQMLVEPAAVEANLRRAEAMTADAASQGCCIVVLPECFDVGWLCPAARELAEPVPGPRSDRLCRLAQDRGVYLACGFTERDGERIYNTALLISPAGHIVLKHRKINELALGRSLYAPGRSLAVAETPIGIIGLSVCADNFPDALPLSHSLARMGAQLLLSPSSWAMPADHDNQAEPYGVLWRTSFEALGRMFDLTSVAVSNVGYLTAGAWAGYKCVGCSMAVGPGGQTLACGGYGPSASELIVASTRLATPIGEGTEISEQLMSRGYCLTYGAQPLPPGLASDHAR